jgi:hypothetical protein
VIYYFYRYLFDNNFFQWPHKNGQVGSGSLIIFLPRIWILTVVQDYESADPEQGFKHDLLKNTGGLDVIQDLLNMERRNVPDLRHIFGALGCADP